MNPQTPIDDETMLSRVECKYLITEEVRSGIREYIKPFVKQDRFAHGHADGRYPISSLYLDCPRLSLYRSTADGLKNRFKLRVRTYSDSPADKAFFEVKKRMNGIVYKFRESVERAKAIDLVEGNSHEAAPKSDLAEFLSLREIHGAEPLMRVKYKREAYVSKSDDPVRLTFDDDLEGALTLDSNLTHLEGDWLRVPMTHSILELKFTNLYPSWVAGMVQEFQLQRTSVPKYVLCVEEAARLGYLRAAI
jgi:hypothetical protein